MSSADGTENGSSPPPHDLHRIAFNRLRRALVKIRKCVNHYAEEFCDELHKDYPSLIKCWQWTREIHHLMEVGVDLEDVWPSTTDHVIWSLVDSEAVFLEEVKKVLRGEQSEPLLECGFWVGYNDPVWQIPAGECDQRLKSAGASGGRFLQAIDDALRWLDSELGINSFPNGMFCPVAANVRFHFGS